MRCRGSLRHLCGLALTYEQQVSVDRFGGYATGPVTSAGAGGSAIAPSTWVTVAPGGTGPVAIATLPQPTSAIAPPAPGAPGQVAYGAPAFTPFTSAPAAVVDSAAPESGAMSSQFTPGSKAPAAPGAGSPLPLLAILAAVLSGVG